MIRSRLIAVGLSITVASVYACVKSVPTALCGGGSGTEPVTCQFIPPEIDLCRYKDSVGAVKSCGGGFASGSRECVKNSGKTGCKFTRTYQNCCGSPTMAPVNKSANVVTYSPRPNSPCPKGG